MLACVLGLGGWILNQDIKEWQRESWDLGALIKCSSFDAECSVINVCNYINFVYRFCFPPGSLLLYISMTMKTWH